MKFILIALLIAGVAYYFYSSSNNKKLAADNVRIGAEFLASNKDKPLVTTTASGLQYEVLTPGSGTVHPTATSGAGAQLAMTIALVHVLFNVFAVVLIYGIPLLRDLPVRAAEGLARVGSENKLLALGYVAGLFFALPALMMVAAK